MLHQVFTITTFQITGEILCEPCGINSKSRP